MGREWGSGIKTKPGTNATTIDEQRNDNLNFAAAKGMKGGRIHIYHPKRMNPKSKKA